MIVAGIIIVVVVVVVLVFIVSLFARDLEALHSGREIIRIRQPKPFVEICQQSAHRSFFSHVNWKPSK